jgi:hypothetical protein
MKLSFVTSKEMWEEKQQKVKNSQSADKKG